IWEELPRTERKYLAREIGNYKFVQCAFLLQHEFLSLHSREQYDEDYLVLLVHSLTKIEDRRSRRIVVKFLDLNSKRVQLEVLKLLSVVGGFWDYAKVKKVCFSADKDILRLALNTMVLLRGVRSIPDLIEHYYKTQETEVKIKVLRLLSDLAVKKSVEALLNMLQKEKSPKLVLRITWALEAISQSVRQPVLFKYFREGEEYLKVKILPLIVRAQSEDAFALLIQILSPQEKGYLLKITALELIASFNRQEGLEAVSFYAHDYKNPICYYAVTSYFKHRCHNHLHSLEKFIQKVADENSIVVELLLHAVKELVEPVNSSPIIEDFIKKKIFSAYSNNRYLAVLASAKFPNVDMFKVLRIVEQKEIEIQIKQAISSAYHQMIQSAPELLMKVDNFLEDASVVSTLNENIFQDHIFSIFFKLIKERGINAYLILIKKILGVNLILLEPYFQDDENKEALLQIIKQSDAPLTPFIREELLLGITQDKDLQSRLQCIEILKNKQEFIPFSVLDYFSVHSLEYQQIIKSIGSVMARRENV
ncbi:MAG: hypothetical protein KBD63_04955, partial [Bacteriovoracaceae bacterium]|nr:hypothetical protein [Bacteriovoracaceae bacterium]